MKKIPTLFKRIYNIHRRPIAITEEVKEGFEWVLEGEGIATVKWDGACCAVDDGELYKRFDAKRGRKIPDGAIPCCEPDPITGHWPHWVKCDRDNPADKWFFNACDRARGAWGFALPDGTYEAVGPHFNGNPYMRGTDTLVMHGDYKIDLPDRSFDGIRQYLANHMIEGIVFWKDDKPQYKIKRTDFGFRWGNAPERETEPYVGDDGLKGYKIGGTCDSDHCDIGV